MSKWNRVDLPFYQSQASTRHCEPLSPNHKLYTSRAEQQSPTNKNNPQILQKYPKQEKFKYEIVIDSLSNQSSAKKYDVQGQNQLSRNKSTESTRWQSPSKGCSKIETYASIIEEINQHNDKALEQLDDDLKRIKNNLSKVQQEVVVDKSLTQTEALYEEIQLLQEQNQRLREKNLHLLDEKKKLAQTLEQYESLYQREKAKQSASLSLKLTNQERSGEQGAQLLKLKVEMEERLRQKSEQCEQLQKEVESLIRVKTISDRTKTLYSEEKNKFIDKIAQLQKQIGALTLKFEDSIKIQLQKKDKYFLNLLQTEKDKSDALLKKIKSSNRQTLQFEMQQKFKQKDALNKKLEKQIEHFRQRQSEDKRQIQKIKQQLKKTEQKIQILNNQIQFLTFAHKQASQRVSERDQQIKNIRQKMTICQNELKKTQTECSALNLRCQQQKNRYILLQQLYNRMQKESQSFEVISQQHLNNFQTTMQDLQKQIHNSKIKVRDLIDENRQLDRKISDLSIQNEKLSFQIRVKNQEVITLKSANLALHSNMKKQQKIPNYVSPPKYINRERVLSGQPRVNINQIREKQHIHQYTRLRGLEKQLEGLINDCKIQRQRQKITVNDKEKKLKQAAQGQKKKTEDLSSKIEELKKNCDRLAMQKLTREEQLLEAIRKRQSQIVAHETKLNQMKLTINRLQFQKTNLKSNNQMKLVELKQESMSKNNDNSQVKEIKQEFLYFVESILREIKTISDNFKEQKYDKKEIFLKEIGLFNSLKDIRLFAQLNFAIKMLSEYVNGLAKKNRQLQKQNKQKQKTQNDLRSNNSQKIIKSNRIAFTSIGRKSMVQEQERYRVEQMESRLKFQVEKYSELQFNFQQKCKGYNKLFNELEDQSKEIRQLKKQINQLKEEKQELQEKNRKHQRKIIEQQEQILSKTNKLESLRGRQAQRERVNTYIPSNDTPQTVYNEIDSYGLYEARMRSRIRSVRHASPLQKRNVEENSKWQEQAKIAQLEQINMNFKKQLQAKAAQINTLRKEKNEWQIKEKKNQESYQLKENEIKVLEKNVDDLKKKKKGYQLKIKKLQNESKILVQQVEKLNMKIEQLCNDNTHYQQLNEKSIRDLQTQKQMLERKIKKQLIQKDSKLVNLAQKNQVQILELNSEINNLKEKAFASAIQHESLSHKNQKLVYQNLKLNQKISQFQQNTKILQLRLQNEQKQREKLLQVFKTNTSKLTKMLQQKQIEIQQLKFIQQSTIINCQYSKNQLSNKKHSDSAYSFRYEE